LEKTDLRELIGHREAVPSDCPLEMVHKQFGTHHHEFMAVLDGARVLGVCSRQDIGMRLGARYGFALFSRKPVREYLSPAPVLVRLGQPISEVLETVFSRADESFYDDVLLLDRDGQFLGLIYVHSLVRLQTQFLRDNIRLLETQKRVIHEKNQQMEEDLVMAREIQLAMLPPEQLSFPADALPGDAGMRFARLYRPAEKVGGDFLHVAPLSEHAVGIFIADVMGHGVRSALVTAMLRALVEETGSAATDPGQLLTHLNRELSAILRQTGDVMFATAFYLVADSRAGTLRFASAGHPAPMRVARRSGAVTSLRCPRGVAGPGLCVFENAAYGTAEARLEGDDIILLFTDGLIEASDAEGDLYGPERLREMLQRDACLDIAALVESVFAEVEQFAGEASFEDDVCLAGLNVVLRDSLVSPGGALSEPGAGV